MPLVGVHASHEQFAPSRLRDLVVAAEAAGFGAAMCSDHLAPWSHRQGHSGFAWTWLGAAMEATALPFGVVTAPGQRYHPVIVAQAIATLGELFPGRFWAALGSGQALNEHVTGERWPDKPARDRRLLECVDVFRALLTGEEVTHDGLVRVDRARLWTVPAEVPRLIGAAVSEATARRVGGWADGLITVAQPTDALRRVVDAFRDGGGDGKPVAVQVHLSWADTDEQALAQAHEQWRNGVLSTELAWNLETPTQFDQVQRWVRPDDVAATLVASADPKRHLVRLLEIADLGVDELYLHQVAAGAEQERFVDVFAEQVLPELAP